MRVTKNDFWYGIMPGGSLSIWVTDMMNYISWVDFASITNAFLIGFAGGLGGWLIKKLLDHFF